MNKFSEKIRELRESKNLNQVQLAQIFNVTKQTIYAWENNIQQTDFDTLIKIAEYFEVTTDYLLGLED